MDADTEVETVSWPCIKGECDKCKGKVHSLWETRECQHPCHEEEAR